MRILKAIILATATLAIAPASIPGQKHDGLKRTTASEISTRTDREKGVIVTSVNRRFTFTDVYPDNIVSDEQFRTLLLLEEFRAERILRGEGQQGSVTVHAWIGKDNNPRENLWTVDQEGDEGAIAGRFYRITKHGCCGAEDTYVFFNIMSGTKVFTSTRELVQIEVPNTPNALKRYIAYRSDMASIPYAESNDPDKVAGVVEYGSESEVLARVVITFKRARQDTGTPKIQMLYNRKLADAGPLLLWGADKKNDKSSLSGFSMLILYDRNNRLLIPVSNDTLQLTRTGTHPRFALSLEAPSALRASPKP